MKVSPHFQPLAKPHFLHSPSCQTGFKQKFPLRRTPGLILLIRVLSRFLSILNCAPNPPRSLSDAPQPPAWDSGEATLTILVCSAENLEDKRAELGAGSWEPRTAPQLHRAPAGQTAPCISLPPAQLGPSPLPSSALQGLFQQGEERTAGPAACSLLPQGLALWGVLQAGSPHLHLPHPRVDPEFFLIHQPLEQSQLEAGGETGQDAAERSRARIPDLNPNSAWFVPDSAHSRLAVASPSFVGACLLSNISGNSPGLTLPGLGLPMRPTQYKGLGQAHVHVCVVHARGVRGTESKGGQMVFMEKQTGKTTEVAKWSPDMVPVSPRDQRLPGHPTQPSKGHQQVWQGGAGQSLDREPWSAPDSECPSPRAAFSGMNVLPGLKPDSQKAATSSLGITEPPRVAWPGQTYGGWGWGLREREGF